MGGGLWQGIFLQTGAKSKVNEASQKRSLELVYEQTDRIFRLNLGWVGR